MYPDEDQCHYCQHPRWKEVENLRIASKRDTTSTKKKRAYAQHVYIPVTHRLQLWWSDKRRAETMIRYRNSAVMDRHDEKFSDFWSGRLCNELQSRKFSDASQEPMLAKDTDVAFFLSTDGVKVFKSRRAFYMWPILLVCIPFCIPFSLRCTYANIVT
jgi:hypothetical protein